MKLDKGIGEKYGVHEFTGELQRGEPMLTSKKHRIDTVDGRIVFKYQPVENNKEELFGLYRKNVSQHCQHTIVSI